MATWPTSVPDELSQQGYRGSVEDTVIRTQNSAGPSKRRPRTTLARRLVTGTIRMTNAELDAFWEFYETDLKNGSLSFDFPDPRDRTTDLTVAFTAAPQDTNIGASLYRVTVQMATET